MNGLDLFSGIGGLTLALSPWVRPVAYCENDRYCQSVLLSRMRDRELPQRPIWDDITTLLPSMLPRHGIDIIYGGFPCQDISCAGARVGLEGERSGLFFEIMRLVDEIRPRFVFLENVAAITTNGLGRVCGELAGRRYDSRWTIVSAKEVGAVHIRNRWWLLAHSDNQAKRMQQGSELKEPSALDLGDGSNWEFAGASERLSKPRVDRTGDGIPFKVDRYRGLGNSVVPTQAREAFKRLAGIGGE